MLLLKYADQDIQQEREAVGKELREAHSHVYDMARETLNSHFGDAVEHGMQAGTHAWEAFEHHREASRMERENEQEREGGAK